MKVLPFIIALFSILSFPNSSIVAQEIVEEEAKPNYEFVIHGKVTDLATKKPLVGAKVTLKGSDKSVVEMVTDKHGKYRFDRKEKKGEFYVKYGVSYSVTVNAEGYDEAEEEEDTSEAEDNEEFEMNFTLKKKE